MNLENVAYAVKDQVRFRVTRLVASYDHDDSVSILIVWIRYVEYLCPAFQGKDPFAKACSIFMIFFNNIYETFNLFFLSTATSIRNVTAAKTVISLQTTSFTPTLRTILTPQAATVTATQTTTVARSQTTIGQTSTTFMQSTSQPETTTTILTIAKPNVSTPVSAPVFTPAPTESVVPTTGVNIKLCSVHTENKSITDEFGCSNAQPVYQTSCQGFCNSRAVANVTSPLVHVQCFCCKPKNLSLANVPMKCPDGGKKVFKYVIITECSCDSCDSTVYEAKLRTVVGPIYGNATQQADKDIFN